MRSLTFFFVLISTMGLSQFSPIWTVNSNFNSFDVRSFEMNDSGQILLITDPYNGGSTANLMVYSSSNFGVSWDSTLLLNFGMMKDNSAVTEEGNMYVAALQYVNIGTGNPSYQRKVIHSSLDGGNTWLEKTIDSISGSNKERSLSFLNDSTGLFFYQNGEYLTQDYGATWQKVYGLGAECLGILNDRFILYTYQDILTINPITGEIDSMQYLPYCEGNVDQSCFKNGVAYRMIFAQDGQQQGYTTFPSNYASLNIDTLPLGNQTVIHFPQRAALVDIEVTESCIHLVLDGRYARSCDGGNTFYDVDAFNGNMNEQVVFLDFINDTLGFAVTKNLITFEWRLWKTTNGGGTNLAPILTNSFIGGLSVSELAEKSNFEIYPNPTPGKLSIRSDNQIEKLELYSILGERIQDFSVQQKELEVDLSHFEAGVYFVRVYSKGGASDKKIVLTR